MGEMGEYHLAKGESRMILRNPRSQVGKMIQNFAHEKCVTRLISSAIYLLANPQRCDLSDHARLSTLEH